ncbi:MAG TPA: cupin, partial [Reyranella sp.]|nr:cupin [Reyranella sp.]
MPVVEELKRIVEKLTGIGRPRRRELARLTRPRAPQLFRFRDDGETPNSRLPLVVYRGALQLDEAYDPA